MRIHTPFDRRSSRWFETARLAGAVPIRQNDGGAVTRRSVTLETVTKLAHAQTAIPPGAAGSANRRLIDASRLAGVVRTHQSAPYCQPYLGCSREEPEGKNQMQEPNEGAKAHANSPNPGNAQHGLGMTPEMMLDLARKAAELVVERIENLPRGDAWDGDFRETLEHKLMVDPPEDGRSGVEVLEEAARDILPYAMRLDHPKCFAFVPSAPTWPGVLADFMAAGFNINECTWLVASGASQVELVVLEWFRQWLGYPEGAGGCYQRRVRRRSVDAFVAAREAAGSPDRATVYMSDQSHSAFVRAAMIVGVRRDCIRMIPCDERFRLDMAALTAAVAEDRAAGCNPIAICANAGATATGAVDPLVAMADYCAAEGIWLHVDAAYGGFAVITDEGRKLLRGIERADSVGLDAHKWLFQPYEAGCLLVKDVRTLEEPFGGPGPFPQIRSGAQIIPTYDRGLQLSRSFRALKTGFDPDLRHGRIPAGGGSGNGICRPRRGLRSGKPGA